MDAYKKAVDEYQRLTPNEYIKLRLDDQQQWFSQKSSKYQKLYKRFKKIEIVLISLIPLVTILPFQNDICNKILTIALSVIAAIIKYFNIIDTNFDLWVKYRNISEALKAEKYLYITGASIYDNSDSAFKLLVERVESIISKSNEQWTNTIQEIPKHIQKNIPKN